jgi:hypothetical protein
MPAGLTVVVTEGRLSRNRRNARGQGEQSLACPYEAFEPAEARRLVEKIEWHYTPKHGSWLNVAEMELSVLARQCLDRRIPDLETLRREVAAWEQQRNAAVVKVD